MRCEKFVKRSLVGLVTLYDVCRGPSETDYTVAFFNGDQLICGMTD